MFEVDEHPKWSVPVTVNISSLFPANFVINSIEEVTLTGHMTKADLHRLSWNVNGM